VDWRGGPRAGAHVDVRDSQISGDVLVALVPVILLAATENVGTWDECVDRGHG